ncbi:MAG: HNH endonuclease [Spirochaetes bacterium]|nr:HNH endonuclease [Spirochaetota bacterium]
MIESEVLVLNAGFVPIRITTVKEAICLLLSDKAVPVVEEDTFIRSPSIAIKVPSVIAILNYHHLPRRKVVFSKLNVIYRDDMQCQYCGKRFQMKHLTVDHVIPRSRWEAVTGKSLKEGFSSWHNLVCACKWCNNQKGNKLVHEIGWSLLRTPFEPEYIPYIVVTAEKAKKKGWLPFCGFNVKVVEMIP